MTSFYNINKIVDRSIRYSDFIKDKDAMKISGIHQRDDQEDEDVSYDTFKNILDNETDLKVGHLDNTPI